MEDLTMILLQCFRYFGFLVYAIMAGYILYRNPKSLLNISCALLISSFAIWTIADPDSLSNDFMKETVILFQNIASFGWISIASFFICFSLAFSKREKLLKKKSVLVLIFILPVILLSQEWTVGLSSPILRDSGWYFGWKESFWTYLYYVYYISFMLTSIYIIYRHGIQTKQITEKKQSEIIVATAIISLIGATVTDVIMPLLDIHVIPQIGKIVLFVFGGGIVYAIVKYEFLIVSIAFAADNILSTMGELLILTNQEGSILNVNKAVTDTLKFDQKELSGKSIATLLSDSHLTITLLERITQGEIIKNHDAYLLVKDAGEIPVIFSCSPLKDKKGEMKGIVFVASDNTLRKRIEEALQESEARYRLLFETSVDGILMVDVETMTFKYANPALCSMLGYSEEELTTLGIQNIHPKQDLQRILDEFKLQSRGDKTLASDIPCLRKDGTIVYADINTTTISIDGRTMAVGHFRDITERKQAEEALAQEQYLMSALMHNLPDYIYLKDKESRFIKISKAHAKSLRLSSAEEAIGKTDFDFFSEEYARHTYEDEQEIIRTGKLLTKEEKETWSDRPDTWVSTIKFPLVNQDGSILGIFGISWDITERMKMEEALHKSEQRYRLLIENANEGILVAENGFLKFVNPMMQELTDFTKEELLTLPFVDFVHPEDRELVISNHLKRLKGEQDIPRYHLRLFTKDGNVKWIEMNGVKIEWEGAPATLNLLTDISKRKLAEDKLRESEEKLSTLFDSMTEMVMMNELVFNEQGEAIDYRITDCNPSFTAIIGIEKEEIIGKLGSEIFQNEASVNLSIYAKVAITGEPYEFTTYYAPIGKHLIISVVSPKKNYFSTIATDITVIQKIQDEIKDKNKELENYLYVASHDLRSPLVNIQGFSYRFQKQIDAVKNELSQCELETETKHSLDKLTNEDIPKTLHFILSNVTKMETLINGLLQISRTGRVVMKIAKVNMNRLIETIIGGNNFQITELSAKVTIQDLCDCYGDESLLNQLFSNIIGNALKYRDPNRQLVIEIASQVQSNKVIYSISDTGIGIDARHLEKVWDVFYRVDPDSEVSGEGIGLSVVKRIIDKHKGKIWVESEVGKGSVFYIELPRTEFTE